ncbi:MAG TPA: thermonuclease family protein [Rhizomicrobium sp.]
MAQAAAPFPDCAPAVKETNVRIVRVEEGGALVLSDKRVVHLEGIALPAGAREYGPDATAREAVSALSDLVSGKVAALAVRDPKEDRYGRLRAQVFVGHAPNPVWIQADLLAKGWARVRIAPDRRECAAQLYAAEDGAHRLAKGMWSQPFYAVRTPEQALKEVGTYRLVEGRIESAVEIGGRVYLEFGRDPHRSFVAIIDHDDLRSFRDIGIDPLSYAGRRVRVRGWIARFGRPVIEIAIPESIQVLDVASP